MDDDVLDRPAMVVSSDSHVGPRLVEDLRAYCPKKYLEEFDNDVSKQAHIAEKEAAAATMAGTPALDHPNLDRPGHYDPHERIRDMDYDGIAADTLFHFSQNGQNLPWVGHGLFTVFDFERGAVAFDIYNRWLADFCSVDPTRFIGLAYLPTWDIDASVTQLRAAHALGLKAVNFPPPGRPGHTEVNHPDWDPFWAACAELDMALVTHASGAAFFDYFGGPGATAIMIYESGGYMARRSVWWLTLGGVFERHPNLRLIITEQFEGWWNYTLHEVDVVSDRFGGDLSLPRRPSEYMAENVYIGASFLSNAMALDAVHSRYADRVIWGSDYPHIEGTFLAPEAAGDDPVSQLSLRNTLDGVPAAEAQQILGLNGVRAYGLDQPALEAVASRIGAPTLRQLLTPPDRLPEVPDGSMAFRGQVGFLS